MKRPLVLALTAAATLFGASAAQAARVDWSIGVNLPPLGAVVAPVDPGYPAYARPVGYVPQQRLIEPPPLYVPQPAAYLPRPHVWLPPLPPLPPLPRLSRFDHDHWRHDGRDGHDRWHQDGRDRHDGRDSWRR